MGFSELGHADDDDERKTTNNTRGKSDDAVIIIVRYSQSCVFDNVFKQLLSLYKVCRLM